MTGEDGWPADPEARLTKLVHDLRTPLTIVSGSAEVLAADRPVSDEARREYAERIHAAAADLRRLLDGLLDGPRNGGGQAA